MDESSVMHIQMKNLNSPLNTQISCTYKRERLESICACLYVRLHKVVEKVFHRYDDQPVIILSLNNLITAICEQVPCVTINNEKTRLLLLRPYYYETVKRNF